MHGIGPWISVCGQGILKLGVCCSLSRKGRSTPASGRWKKIRGAVGRLYMPLFTGGKATHAASLCMSPGPSVWHAAWTLLPSVAHVVALSRESLPAYLLEANKASFQPENYIRWYNSAHASPLHVMGTVYWIQSQNYENTAFQTHQDYRNAASLSHPDTWARKPDCLHLPYRGTYVLSN